MINPRLAATPRLVSLTLSLLASACSVGAVDSTSGPPPASDSKPGDGCPCVADIQGCLTAAGQDAAKIQGCFDDAKACVGGCVPAGGGAGGVDVGCGCADGVGACLGDAAGDAKAAQACFDDVQTCLGACKPNPPGGGGNNPPGGGDNPPGGGGNNPPGGGGPDLAACNACGVDAQTCFTAAKKIEDAQACAADLQSCLKDCTGS